MIPAAAYSAFPAMLTGGIRLPLAREIHDRVLFADSKMNKADWLTDMATIAGVLGITYGLWWADAVAAAVISADILHDGVSSRMSCTASTRAPSTQRAPLARSKTPAHRPCNTHSLGAHENESRIQSAGAQESGGARTGA